MPSRWAEADLTFAQWRVLVLVGDDSAGATVAEFVARRPANAISGLPGGRTLLQWQRLGYRVALGFEPDGTCYGVTHEYRSSR